MHPVSRVTLPALHPAITTSRLGFGCVNLTTLNDRAKALRLLETAFDAGITHSDTARLYGSGHAEGILGELLQGKRDRVTITTKFGKAPPKMAGDSGGSEGKSRGGPAASLKRMVKWGMQLSGFIRKLVSSAASRATIRGQFDPASAQRSLETSLRELGTDYVDLLMLHDCTLEDTKRDDTLAFLYQQVAKGTIRAFGATHQVRQTPGRSGAQTPRPRATVRRASRHRLHEPRRPRPAPAQRRPRT